MYTATFTFSEKRYYVRSSTSQRDAERKAAKKLAALESGVFLIDENMYLSEYANNWVETYKKGVVSETQYKAYKSRIETYINPHVGIMKMKDIKPSHLQKILNEQAGKSKSHCQKMKITLNAIFAQAVKDGVATKNVADGLSIPKSQDGTHRSITEDERKAVLKVAQVHRLGLFVQTLLYCGLRPQEAIALKWSDIDQINKRIMVRCALKKDGYIAETKSAAGKRNVPIPPQLWRKFQIPSDLSGYVFKNGNRCYTRSSLRTAWESFRAQIDIELGADWTIGQYGIVQIINSVIADDFTMYCLRHTYCTDLEAAGVPINVAKYLMGHSSIEMTSMIYTHMREDTLKNVADKIAGFIENGATVKGVGATVGATLKGKTRVNNG